MSRLPLTRKQFSLPCLLTLYKDHFTSRSGLNSRGPNCLLEMSSVSALNYTLTFSVELCVCGGLLLYPGGVLPYLGYICMCGPKGYGFSAVLVINRVSILADFGHFGHK